MKSIRQQVFDYIKIHPEISVSDIKIVFKECPNSTIGAYHRAYHRIDRTVRNNTLSLKDELEKIIKDYKQPASARVQAIREYRTLVEIQPEESEDSLLTLYKMVENDS